MDDEWLAFNGIDGATGNYLLPSLTEEELGTIALGVELDEAVLDRIAGWVENQTVHPHRRYREPAEGVDPRRLEESGWGMVFAEGTDPGVRDALGELIEHRRSQASRIDPRFFAGDLVYHRSWTTDDFLDHYGLSDAPAEPERCPYYLLLVGDPERIPFRFQYEIAPHHAVGRIHFETEKGEPDLDAYASYATTVVACDRGRYRRPTRASFFGVRNGEDRATRLVLQGLIEPLREKIAAFCASNSPHWRVDGVTGEDATKARLLGLLGSEDAPAVLFVGCHGVRFPIEDPRLRAAQGALICADWPGPGEEDVGVGPEQYVSAADVLDDSPPRGQICLPFACHSAGTPQLDDFATSLWKRPERIAPNELLSRLPQRLLGHPRGGALAVVGHIDRAWTTTFTRAGEGGQVQAFLGALERLLQGYPVGAAMLYLVNRFAKIAVRMNHLRDDRERGRPVSRKLYGRLWRTYADARNLIVFGDPAARVATETWEL